MTLVTATEQLAAFCQSLKGADFVTVDTEFMRERTYWPKVCLIQLGGPDAAVAVDPLAESIDLAPLLGLMNDPSILKVFHAARQDIEIFYNLTGKVPAPLFDSQIAAMVCGFGEAASYESLAGKLAGARIDKSSRFTDWAYRPLSQKQIDYALGDVTHLRVVYEKLREQLAENGRTEWVTEEMAQLSDPAKYRMDPETAWQRLKLRNEKPRVRALVKELAAWREAEAQKINVPRQRVIRDETLLEIAHHAPATTADLARTRGLSQNFAEGRQGRELMAAVERAQAVPSDQCPPGAGKRVLPSWIGPTVDLLKVLLKHVCEQHGVAPKLIATTDDLEDIAANDNADVPALHGWRHEMFGKLALQLKHGELALKLEKRGVALAKVGSAERN
ncbi:MAG: ribonuclease D [Alphaproteobacteria bacterium]|nr:ribonuclease D [Alphaproteobacteria bacterium]